MKPIATWAQMYNTCTTTLETFSLPKNFTVKGFCCVQRGSYTEPQILMDSIRSPGKLLILYLESPSGVHLESTWTSLKWSNCVLLKNPARLQVYSTWSPDRVHKE